MPKSALLHNQDVYRLYELRPTDGSVLARLVTMSLPRLYLEFAKIAFLWRDVHSGVRLVYGYYLVGDIQLYAKAIPTDWAVGILGGVQYRDAGFISWTTVHPEASSSERARFRQMNFFFITQCSILLLCSALFRSCSSALRVAGSRHQAISRGPSARRARGITSRRRASVAAIRASSADAAGSTIDAFCCAYRLIQV